MVAIFKPWFCLQYAPVQCLKKYELHRKYIQYVVTKDSCNSTQTSLLTSKIHYSTKSVINQKATLK